MRTFAKIQPRFWTPLCKVSQAVRREGPDALLVSVYLKSCPMSTALGLYYLPLATISHETGLDMDRVRTAMVGLARAGFAEYCEEEQVVWVPEMAAEQIGKELKPQDHRVKWVHRELATLEESRFYGAFLARYGVAYHLVRETQESPGGGSSSKEQGQGPGQPCVSVQGNGSSETIRHAPRAAPRVQRGSPRPPDAPPGWRPPRRRPWDPPPPSPDRMRRALALDRLLREAAGGS